MKTLWRGIDAILKNLSGFASGDLCKFCQVIHPGLRQDTLDGKAARSSYKKLALKAGVLFFFLDEAPRLPGSA